jgi:intracellular sulfur oxidation DsrE/DsrF family protein
MRTQNISDEYLNSFVDDQLDSIEKINAFDIINQNESLKDRVCELSALKVIVKHAYKQPPEPARPHLKPKLHWGKHLQSLAACLLVLVGGVTGWLGHDWIGKTDVKQQTFASLLLSNRQDASVTADTRKVIVHINNSNVSRLKVALDETEALLTNYQNSNHNIEVEVIANKQGVDLLRTQFSPYKQRISLMQEKYPNLSFLVCGQTINKLRNEGKNVELLPHIGIASSAADQINKRLHQGWGYVKI